MRYDEAYRKTEHYFGPGATPILRKYYHRITKASPILDIGAGQGRNTLFLARNRYVADAIDPSKVAIDTVSSVVAKERLAVRTFPCGFDDFVPEVDFYSGILIFGIIQILSPESIALLLQKVRAWTGEGSLVFVTTFTTADPSYPERSQKWRSMGGNSFADKNGNIATYLESGEILGLFDDFTVIHHWEGVSPKHSHGDGLLEQHGIVEAVFLR
jgi:tellurite methyltransferase